MGKGADSPDVTGAAEIEGEFARETARDVTYADRPDQYNPFGSVKWQQYNSVDPATGENVTKWRQTQSLSPASKGILNDSMSITGDKSKLGAQMMDRVRGEMGGAPDWEQFGDVEGMNYDPTAIRQAAEDAAYKKEANRLDPRFARERDQLDLRLRNQGLSPGDQAYDAQMSTYQTGRDDAYEQARLGSTEIGRAEADQLWGQQLEGNERANALRQQQIQEYIGKRGYSLSEVDQLTQGQTLSDLVDTYGGA